MLTEQEVSRSWRILFQAAEITSETVARAEELIDALRPESPLRHRLGLELIEIRKMRQLADA